MTVVDVPVFEGDKACQRLFYQSASCHPKQSSSGEIGFQDQTFFAECDIAHRRQIVEVKIPCPRGFQFLLRPAKLLVLHLQLDLMNPQFVERPPCCFGRQGLQVFRGLGRIPLGDLFCLPSQILPCLPAEALAKAGVCLR